ncbi:hypothetical protein K1719_005378 [Acacia pycnantha]|nr:hypothetical protein K1719_005378 [Acacia pycnantha]
MDMSFLKLPVSYFVLFTSFNVASSKDDIPAYYDHNCTININFTSNSPYQVNLNTLLMSLYSKATATDTMAKFYNATVGTPNMNDTAYGEYMCRGDVPMEVCQNCVQDTTSRIASECPYNREAIICSHISERHLGKRIKSDAEYNAVVEAETSTFATKEANLTSGGSLYTLVQRTTDLSPQFCTRVYRDPPLVKFACARWICPHNSVASVYMA